VAEEADWHDYDPAWLVELARVQYPGEPWLQDALSRCTRFIRDSEHLYYFVDRMEGKFKANIELYSPENGKIILDLLKDGRIGAMEIYGTDKALA
jgi:hypothetical protein